MAQALYRKWRPQTFDDVVGQEHVTSTLKNQIATGRIGHAYLFVGSRGCGKTTSARIFAKEINIAGLDPGNPRTKQIAEAIAEGRSLDLIEIDAASNNSVDDVREIRDKVGYQPSELKYKVYIIDEVHMLSAAAFNALLKTLEEPPAHVIFILATTDPQKIPPTVLSRCQRFNFKRVPVEKIVGRLRKLCDGEDIEADDHALRLIARYANGGLRDAESLLDQLGSSSSMRITANDVREALGATDSATVKALIDGLIAKDPSAGFEAIQLAMDQGADARQVAKQMVDYLRSLMQVKASANQNASPAASTDPSLSEAEKYDLAQNAEHMSMAQIAKATRAFSTAINEMRTNTDAQLALEMAYLDCIVVDELAQRESRVAEVATPRQRPAPPVTPAQVAPPSATPANGTSATPTAEPAASPAAPTNQAPVQPPPPRRSTGNIETVRSNWKNVIAEVNATNKAAAALLRSCHPHDMVGNVVQLRADHDLIRQRLDDAKNKGVVVAALRRLMNDDGLTLLVFVGQPPIEPDEDPVLKAAKRLGGTVRE